MIKTFLTLISLCCLNLSKTQCLILRWFYSYKIAVLSRCKDFFGLMESLPGSRKGPEIRGQKKRLVSNKDITTTEWQLRHVSWYVANFWRWFMMCRRIWFDRRSYGQTTRITKGPWDKGTEKASSRQQGYTNDRMATTAWFMMCRRFLVDRGSDGQIQFMTWIAKLWLSYHH